MYSIFHKHYFENKKKKNNEISTTNTNVRRRIGTHMFRTERVEMWYVMTT